MTKILLIHALALTLVLLTTGCDDSSRQIKQLTDLQRETQNNLMECKSQLEVYRGVVVVDNNMPAQEPEQPSEPSCEDIDYTIIFKDGKQVASCRSVEQEACGLSASYCVDGFEYKCLTNVKLGFESRKECSK